MLNNDILNEIKEKSHDYYKKAVKKFYKISLKDCNYLKSLMEDFLNSTYKNKKLNFNVKCDDENNLKFADYGILNVAIIVTTNNNLDQEVILIGDPEYILNRR